MPALTPSNIVKGRQLETLVRSLFEIAGFTVMPVGVEHQIPDVESFTRAEYHSRIPENIRTLPDFLAYRFDDSPNSNGAATYLLKVKYRSKVPSSKHL